MLLESLALPLRWLHVVAAIAWIGESFYFVALDRGLQAPRSPEPGLAGESWSVHGGGFYRKQKFLPAPAELPAKLLWSKWKAYTTWLSGAALFALLYLRQPAIALVDPAVSSLRPDGAVALAIALPVIAWLVYDGLCRVFADARHAVLLGALVALGTLGLCVATTQQFAGRAAFVIAGAVLATLMAGNVFFVIIPGQRRLVAALQRGAAPDPRDGARGKQRSVHNTYFTLPVVFAMLATHEAEAFAHPHAWAVLAGFMAAGAMLRHFFVRWHDGGRAWGLLAAAGLLLVALLAWIAPRAPGDDVEPDAAAAPADAAPATPALPPATVAALAAPTPATADLLPLFALRCGGCHSAHPTLMGTAPKGITYDTAPQAELHAAQILRQAVQLKAMPPGNMTGVTDAERAALGRWAKAHAGS